MAFSVCSLFGSIYAISACHSLGKSAIQKNPAIKDWITENKKMVDHFRLIRNFLSSSNGCKLVKNAHRFVNSRKYLCFCLFMQQRKLFSLNKTTAIPKQLQNAPEKDAKKRLLQFYLFEVSSWQYSTISDKVVVPVEIASQFSSKKFKLSSTSIKNSSGAAIIFSLPHLRARP